MTAAGVVPDLEAVVLDPPCAREDLLGARPGRPRPPSPLWSKTIARVRRRALVDRDDVPAVCHCRMLPRARGGRGRSAHRVVWAVPANPILDVAPSVRGPPRVCRSQCSPPEGAPMTAPSRLDAEQRQRAWQAPGQPGSSTCSSSGGRHRRRRRAGRGDPRPVGRPRRAARLRLGHLLPLLQALPRRPALPRADELRAGPRGAAGAGADAHPARTAPGASRCRSSTRSRHGSGSGPTSPPGSPSTTRWAVPGRSRATSQLTRTQALQLAPALRNDALTGALLYYDAQADDARHTLTMARTAAAYGATVLTSAQVERAAARRASGSSARPSRTSRPASLRRRAAPRSSSTAPACGPTTSRRSRAAGAASTCAPPRACTSSSRATGSTPRRGLILRTEKSVLFVIPWRNALDPRHHRHRLGRSTRRTPRRAAATSTTSSSTLNAVLNIPLTHDDIQGVYAGLRPLLSGRATRPRQLSREHAVARPQPGLISIAGGKYTTYRVMAADAVDAARVDLGGGVPDSVTEQIPLLGAEGYHALVEPGRPAGLAGSGCPAWRVDQPARPLRLARHRPLRPAPRPTARCSSRWRAPRSTSRSSSSTA